MKTLLTFVSLVLFAAFTYGQTNYIEFKDGRKIDFGEEPIKEKSPMFKKSVLKVDGNTYDIETVKGYQHNGTYYAQNFGGFFTRHFYGKINYYSRIETYLDSKGRTKTRVFAYLQKGDNTAWQKFSNNKLINMVRDNKKAKDMAEKHRKTARQGNLLIIAGGLGMFAGAMTIAVSQMSDIKSTGGTVTGIALVGGGLGTVVFGYIKRFKAANNLYEILEYYNKS